jgi:hypothetical protein
MGIWDRGSKDEKLAYLEEERQLLWDRVGVLQEGLVSMREEFLITTTDDVKNAKENSKKTSEYRNRVKGKLSEVEEIVQNLNFELEKAREIKNEINDFNTQAATQKLSIDEAKSRLDDSESEYERKLEAIESRTSSFQAILDKYPDLDDQMAKVDDFILEVENNVDKSDQSLGVLNKKKVEVDNLHRKIFGYVQTNEETGIETKIEGLKDELEDAYGKISADLEESKKRINEQHSNYEKSYEKFQKSYKTKYAKINEDIAALLPDALTAGLSSAFSKKKDEEVNSSKILQSRFNVGIGLMIGVSLIPAFISVYFLFNGKSLEDVILSLPRMVLAILPLYVPIVWFTYSANKKLNLSKRLIEEYAHKEVLSRTYEGLSTQISSISDDAQSEELRFRLLSNFLQVTSENPGKLISNYEASDHPLMEALEQSYKFQMTVDKLEGIPGMGKVAAMIERKTKRKAKERIEKVEEALSEVDDEETTEKI